MDYYAGIDVSLECSSVCVVDANGKIVREGKVASDPQAMIDYFSSLGLALSRIGLEAGPLSQWLYAALRQAGRAVEVLETRHVRDAFKAMPVKSDRNDARGIAQLMRLGWFRPVHCKSMAAQELRAVLTARKLIQSKLRDIENSLRGILRGFGLKVGKTTARSFAGRIRELVAGQANLETIAQALLAVHAVLVREFNGFERRVRIMAREHGPARLLMTTPAVGPIVALTYASAIDDPARFTSSKQTGAHFGLTPKKYQSGETNITGRISKIGDAAVREALDQAAHVDADQTGHRLCGPQKLGDADRQKSRHAQSQGGTGAQACRDHAPHARRRQIFEPGRRGRHIGRITVLGRVTTPGPSEAKSLRRDDGSGQTVIRDVASTTHP